MSTPSGAPAHQGPRRDGVHARHLRRPGQAAPRRRCDRRLCPRRPQELGLARLLLATPFPYPPTVVGSFQHGVRACLFSHLGSNLESYRWTCAASPFTRECQACSASASGRARPTTTSSLKPSLGARPRSASRRASQEPSWGASGAGAAFALTWSSSRLSPQVSPPITCASFPCCGSSPSARITAFFSERAPLTSRTSCSRNGRSNRTGTSIARPTPSSTIAFSMARVISPSSAEPLKRRASPISSTTKRGVTRSSC